MLRHMRHRKKRSSTFRFPGELWRRLYEHDIFTYTASLSYYTLLSFIPLIFIGIAVVGEVVGRNKAVTEQAVMLIRQLFPFMTTGIEKNIYGLVENRGLFGGIGLFTLLWCAHMVLAEGEKVTRKVFGVQKKRSLFLSQVVAWGIFLLSVVFFALSFFLGFFLRLVADDLLPPALLNTLGPFINSLFIKYIPAAMVMLTVAAAYKFLPQRDVPLPIAFTGGVSFAVLWEVAKKLFFIYVGKARYFSLIYGSLGTFMLFLLFVYYSALLFIIIAEVVACALDMNHR